MWKLSIFEMDYISMNTIFEENFPREKCFEKTTSILSPVIDRFICLIISFKYEGIFQTKSSNDTT